MGSLWGAVESVELRSWKLVGVSEQMGDEELRRVGERSRELNWGAELESWGSYMELKELRRVGN